MKHHQRVLEETFSDIVISILEVSNGKAQHLTVWKLQTWHFHCDIMPLGNASILSAVSVFHTFASMPGPLRSSQLLRRFWPWAEQLPNTQKDLSTSYNLFAAASPSEGAQASPAGPRSAPWPLRRRTPASSGDSASSPGPAHTAPPGVARRWRKHGGREHVGGALWICARRARLPAPQHRLGHGEPRAGAGCGVASEEPLPPARQPPLLGAARGLPPPPPPRLSAVGAASLAPGRS